VRYQITHPHGTARKIIVLYILIFKHVTVRHIPGLMVATIPQVYFRLHSLPKEFCFLFVKMIEETPVLKDLVA